MSEPDEQVQTQSEGSKSHADKEPFISDDPEVARTIDLSNAGVMSVFSFLTAGKRQFTEFCRADEDDSSSDECDDASDEDDEVDHKSDSLNIPSVHEKPDFSPNVESDNSESRKIKSQHDFGGVTSPVLWSGADDGPLDSDNSSKGSSTHSNRPYQTSTALSQSVNYLYSHIPKEKDDAQASEVLGPSPFSPENKATIHETQATALSNKLREQLGISEQESLVGEYPCWLLRNILLQGHLYVTDKHICFFAYLPVGPETSIMSGTLRKRSRKTLGYNRYWFVLRSNALSYFVSSADLYFPAGTIDLRYAIRAEVLPGKQGDKSDSTTFIVITESRKYTFKTDSPQSAREWVSALQKEIFRSRNEGDSVKIVIPTGNIIDLEQTSVVSLVSSIKIRAIDNEETYSVDEYIFSFFNRGREAIEAVRKAFRLSGVSKIAIDQSDGERRRSIHEDIINSTRLPGSLGSQTPISRESGPISRYLPNIRGFLSPGGRSGHSTPSGSGAMSPALRRNNSQHLISVPDLDKQLKNLAMMEKSKDSDLLFDEDSSESDRYRKHDSSEEDRAAYDFLSSSDKKNDENFRRRRVFKTPKLTSGMVSKVSEMWGGGRKHFGFESTDDKDSNHFDTHYVTAKDAIQSNEHFRSHFSLGDKDTLVASYYCHLQKAFPVYGKVYLSNNHLCFRSLIPVVHTKMILPLTDVENVTKESGFRFGYSGLVVVIGGHEEIFLEFGNSENRDDCEMMILREIDRLKRSGRNTPHSSGTGSPRYTAETRTARWLTKDDRKMEVPVLLSHDSDPKDKHRGEMDVKKLPEGTRFTLLTIGSRGDVQPYIALGVGLLKRGYKVKIATHKEFGPWIESYGMEFHEIAGDPTELMLMMIDHGMLTVSFVREATSKFRTWIDELLRSSWKACQNTDILIESPSAMAGIHIAEALHIPYYRAFTMPWTRTRAYPHAFIVPEQKMGGSYNYLTYVMFDNIFWKGISGQVNRWRQKELGLGRTSISQMHQGAVPFLYCVSPHILVPPVDYNDWVRVTGYWFLDQAENEKYQPPEDLVEFIRKAREDNKKLVYVGFGSIVISHPKELTEAVVGAIKKTDVRCILAKGWSGRHGKNTDDEVELPPEIYLVKSVPHDWLFEQIDAAVHHGGSGTTGASLRAGLPTIIRPFFADQFFYADRVNDLGIGISLRKLSESSLANAIWQVTHDERTIAKAKAIGKAIAAENGVETAIYEIHRQHDYCLRLVEKQKEEEQSNAGGLLSAATGFQPRSLGNVLKSKKVSCNYEGSTSPNQDTDSGESDKSWTLLEGGEGRGD